MHCRYIMFVLLLASIWLTGIAQEYQKQPEYKYFHCPGSTNGCYESFKDFHSEKPVVTSGFRMEKRIGNEIRDSRAGGYLLRFDGGIPGTVTTTDHIWGVYYEDTLYINRKFFQGKKGFDKVYCMGSYGHACLPRYLRRTAQE